MVNWNHVTVSSRTFPEQNASHAITALSCCFMPISTTRHTTENCQVASASPCIRSKPRYFFTFKIVHYKRTAYYNAPDKITNRTDIRLERRIPNHNRNVAINQPGNGQSTVNSTNTDLQNTTVFSCLFRFLCHLSNLPQNPQHQALICVETSMSATPNQDMICN